jgi:Pvc16 N-terminal domain
MIRDLSQTLRVLLQRDVPPELASAQIVFDHPTEQFKPTQTTVNLFLYDLRENVELRNNETQMTVTNGRAVIQGTPLRLSCSYLATVWTVGASGDEQFLQEHRLLGQVFYALARYPTIPEDLLQGSLRGQQPPLPLSTSPIDTLKSFGEFWTALGNRLRPSISVTATLSMQTAPPQEAASIVSMVDTQLESQRSPVNRSDFLLRNPVVQSETFQIGGVLTMPNREDLNRTTITLVELGYITKPKPNGQYKFGNIPHRTGSAPLTQTLRVQVGDRTQDYPITIPPTARNSYNLQFP